MVKRDKYGTALVDEHCQGCKYLQHYRGIYWEYIEYCSYYADTGLHRNCSPGEGCTCYTPTENAPPGGVYKKKLTEYYELEKERKRDARENKPPQTD